MGSTNVSIIVLKSGPTRRVDPELKPGRLKKKQGNEKPGVTPLSRRVDLTRSGCKPISFYFFTKTMLF
jgi:hypothetical protein